MSNPYPERTECEETRETVPNRKHVAWNEGARFVVEFVDSHLHESPPCSYKWCFGDRTWRAFLKELGID